MRPATLRSSQMKKMAETAMNTSKAITAMRAATAPAHWMGR